jgi:hypothetical protein
MQQVWLVECFQESAKKQVDSPKKKILRIRLSENQVLTGVSTFSEKFNITVRYVLDSLVLSFLGDTVSDLVLAE